MASTLRSRVRRQSAFALVLLALTSTGRAAAQERSAREEPAESKSRDQSSARPPVELRLGGYGELLFAFHDFGENQNRAGGSQRDARVTFDTARLALELGAELPLGIEVEAEVELEHGGTGAAVELEYDEFGEFEQEVERGGEVSLEELYVEKTFAEHYSVSLGRFYVAVGQLWRRHEPTDYLATTRSEAETTVIPAVWDELGLQLRAEWDALRITAQLVNGLDSTGFSSQRWVASGHQGRFELVRATDLAGVGRVDVRPTPGLEVGASAYYGATSRNRPKADLVRDCTGGDPDEVAPCGYVQAPVLLLDGHVHVRRGPVRGTALVLWGHLWNAGAVSERNDRLSNAANVLRTPVADDALSAWAEIGLDVAPWIGLPPKLRVEPFVRFDRYDTMFKVREGVFDNPRFDRRVLTGGVALTARDAFVLKLDASQRRFGSSELRPESSVRLGAGFVL